MTVREFMDILEQIPERDRDRSLSICGDRVDNPDLDAEFDISWMDCSDGILLFLN